MVRIEVLCLFLEHWQEEQEQDQDEGGRITIPSQCSVDLSVACRVDLNLPVDWMTCIAPPVTQCARV